MNSMSPRKYKMKFTSNINLEKGLNVSMKTTTRLPVERHDNNIAHGHKINMHSPRRYVKSAPMERYKTGSPFRPYLRRGKRTLKLHGHEDDGDFLHPPFTCYHLHTQHISENDISHRTGCKEHVGGHINADPHGVQEEEENVKSFVPKINSDHHAEPW